MALIIFVSIPVVILLVLAFGPAKLMGAGLLVFILGFTSLGETGVAPFHADLQDYITQISLVIMTEFGRRANKHGSLGTHHGHGGLIIVISGNLNGRLVPGA